MSSSSYDLVNATTGVIVARGVTLAAAATALGISQAAILAGVDSASFVDAAGIRCTGYFGIWGDHYLNTWKAEGYPLDVVLGHPVIGAPTLSVN